MMSRFCFAFIIAILLLVQAPDVHAQQMSHEHHQHAASEATVTTPAATSADSSSEAEHVPPDPPVHEMQAMSLGHMTQLMQMDDQKAFGKVLLDQLEWRGGSGRDEAVWDVQAWYGDDYNKAWLKSEGARISGAIEDASVELLWDHIIAKWWSAQAGVRHDAGEGPARTWAAVGVQGLAPYWFDIEATAYVGEQGRTAARVKVAYDARFTQRLILQPEIEANLYGKSDAARGVGSGLSDIDLGLRLRYELRREFAPYVGISWTQRFGATADLARAGGSDASDVQFVSGLRIWF
jgi:copper resistance protein B